MAFFFLQIVPSFGDIGTGTHLRILFLTGSCTLYVWESPVVGLPPLRSPKGWQGQKPLKSVYWWFKTHGRYTSAAYPSWHSSHLVLTFWLVDVTSPHPCTSPFIWSDLFGFLLYLRNTPCSPSSILSPYTQCKTQDSAPHVVPGRSQTCKIIWTGARKARGGKWSSRVPFVVLNSVAPHLKARYRSDDSHWT